MRVPRIAAFAMLLVSSACASDAASAWLDAAYEAHGKADRALEAGDARIARRALEAAARAEVPRGVGARDARIVRQDLLFRLAELALEEGDAEEAQRRAEEGLALGREDDVFTANLLIVRGRAFETLGEDRQAAADYHGALQINAQLLRQTLAP